MPEVVLRQFVLFLSVVHRAEAVPRVVVSAVQPERVAVASHGFFKILVCEEFVPAEGVSVGASRVELQRPLEEPQRSLVLLLEAETVPQHAPRLRRQPVQGHALLRQITELDLLLEVPQHRGVHLHAVQPVRTHAPRPLERTSRLRVVDHLGVRTANQTQDVPGDVLRPRERSQVSQSVVAAEHRIHPKAVRDRLQQRRRRRRALRETPRVVTPVASSGRYV